MTTEEKVTVDTAAAKKVFSRIGFALIAFFAASYAVAILLELFCLWILPKDSYTSSLSIIISSVAMYGVGVPVFYFAVRKIKVYEAPRGNARFSTMAVLFAIATCFMYTGSIIGNSVYEFVGEKLGIYLNESTLELVAMIPWHTALVFTVLIAPLFEELVFRKLIIDRVSVYGEKLAILFSAILFAFFHSSIQQFFYALFAGLVFGYLYMRTRRLIYPYILHALVNFFGSVVPLILMQYAGYEELLASETPEAMMEKAAENPIGYAAIMLYSLVILALVFSGFALMFVYVKKLKFEKTALQLPPDSEATVAFTPLGVILFIAVTVALPVVFTLM